MNLPYPYMIVSEVGNKSVGMYAVVEVRDVGRRDGYLHTTLASS